MCLVTDLTCVFYAACSARARNEIRRARRVRGKNYAYSASALNEYQRVHLEHKVTQI